MSNTDSSITITILAKDLASGNIGGFIGKMDTLAKRGGLAGSVMQGVGISMGMMLNPLALVGDAVHAVTGFFDDSLKAAEAMQVAQVKLGTSLRDNVPAWNGDQTAIDDYIKSGTNLGFMANDQRDALAQLVTRTHDVTEAQKLLSEAEDLARLKGIDLGSAVTVLGKVYSGSFTGAIRMGIAIKAGSTATEALAQIQQASAGQAQAYGSTVAGAQQEITASMDELQAEIGTKLIPVWRDMLTGFRDLITGGPHASAAIRDVTDAIAAQAALGQQPQHPFQDQLNSLADGWTALGKVIRPGIDEENQWIAANKAVGDSLGATDADMRLFFGTLKYTGGKSIPEITAALKDLALQQGFASHAAKMDADLFGSAWTGATAEVATAMVDVKYHVLRDVGQLTDGIQNILKDAKTGVHDAAKGLEWAIEHPLAAAHEKSKLQALLTSKDLVKGLNSKNPEIKAAAEFYRKTIMDKLNNLAPAVYQKGIDVATAFVNGVEVTLPSNIFGLFTLGPGTFNGGLGRGGHYGGGRARGGPVGGAAGSVFTVGENGPETLVMGGGATGNIGSAAHTFVYAPQFSTASEAEARRFAENVTPHIVRAMRTASLG